VTSFGPVEHQVGVFEPGGGFPFDLDLSCQLIVKVGPSSLNHPKFIRQIFPDPILHLQHLTLRKVTMV
jgi:hypothetical protein